PSAHENLRCTIVCAVTFKTSSSSSQQQLQLRCRRRLQYRPRRTMSFTKSRPNTYSAVSLSDHRPASKGKKRSNRKQRPILAKAAVDVTACAKTPLKKELRQRQTGQPYPRTTSA